MRLSRDIRSRAITYLQYIQTTLEKQEELQDFFGMISPSLKKMVTKFIFEGALADNDVFSFSDKAISFLVEKIDLIMSQPEQVLINQGDEGKEMYIISKGECECWVKDQMRHDHFVGDLGCGDFFGEVALIAGVRRTATIQTKNYSTLGVFKDTDFFDLCHYVP